MQSTLTNVTTLLGLAVVAFASIAVLLFVSITRDFLPGIVELTAALSVALIFGIAVFAPKRSRQAMISRLDEIASNSFGYVLAAVVILVLTAVFALMYEKFPWPAPLLLVVVLMAFVVRGKEASQ